jgi:hypothetical protein
MGLPGNTLDEDTVMVDQYGWMGFDSLDAVSFTDNYYLGMYQLHDAPDCAPVGCTQYPANSNSLFKYGEYNWYPFPLGNAMIRPWVSAPHDSLFITYYRVLRFSNFDPNGDPSAGTVSELATTNYGGYVDNAWAGLPGGWYAYGVRAIYNNGVSIVTIGNIIFNDNYSPSPGISSFKLTGQTFPFYNYATNIQNNGHGGIEGVMRGKYRLEIYKPGYHKFIQDSVDIQLDTLIEIELQETPYPIENLTVNPFTGLLKWEPNNIIQFSWQEDTGETCHSLTTPQLLNTGL